MFFIVIFAASPALFHANFSGDMEKNSGKPTKSKFTGPFVLRILYGVRHGNEVFIT